MASRKREKPYNYRQAPYSKRHRPLQLDSAPGEDGTGEFTSSSAVSKAPTMVVVIGVPEECSVLDLKSRFEMYGPISRIRMEPNGVAYVNFRTHDAAQSAVKAAQDSSFPVTLHSVPVQVMLASGDQVLVRHSGRGDNRNNGLFSRLVRGELPLRRQGRGNKLFSTIVNPIDVENNDREEGHENELKGTATSTNSSSGLRRFKGREIVGYDDIL